MKKESWNSRGAVTSPPKRGVFKDGFPNEFKDMIARAEPDEERLKRRLLRAKRISKRLFDDSGPTALPKRIQLKRIIRESLKATFLFRQQLKDAQQRRRNEYGDVKLADFIELIKIHLAGKGCRSRTTGEMVSALPYFDWRLAGIVTRPRNQGACGCCWALAATEAFESRLMYNLNRLRVFNSDEICPGTQIALSIQGVMDCVRDGNCDGGSHTDAFAHFVRDGARLLDFNKEGQPIEDRTAATDKRGRCKEKGRKGIRALTWGFAIPRNPLLAPKGQASLRKLKRALLDFGALAVNVSMDHEMRFSAYKEEIYTDGVYDVDSRTATNHNVLLTGWDDTRGAWIIVNSLGPNWGGSCVDEAKVAEHFPWTLPNVAGFLKRDRGCMYIKYGVSNIGELAAWIETYLDNRELLTRISRRNTSNNYAKR